MTKKQPLRLTIARYRQKFPKQFIALCIGIVFITLVLIDITPFGGNIKFYVKWAECEKKPIALKGPGYMNSKPPYYYIPASFEPLRYTSPDYTCSPLDAEKAGYSASPDRYEFPHLHNK